MRIVIPTYRRPTTQRTLETFAALKERVTLVVRPEEAAEHHSAYPHVGLEVLPPDIVTLPKTRQWILERFWAERFVMADDDVSEVRRRRLDAAGKVVSEPVSSAGGLSWLLGEMEDELEKGAGLCSPSPNWLPPDTHYLEDGHLGKKSAGQCLQLVAVDGPKLTAAGVRYDRVEMAEDVDVLLQVLAKGFDAVQLMEWAFVVPPMGSQSGGIGLEKKERAAKEERAMAKLSLLWPGYVQVGKRSGEKWSVYRSRLLKDARRGAVKSRSLEEVAAMELPPVPQRRAPAAGRVPLTPEELDALGRQGTSLRKELEGRLAGRGPWPPLESTGDPERARAPAEGWEYVASPPSLSALGREAWLNERGREGWRLVPFAAVSDLLLMERRLISSPPSMRGSLGARDGLRPST